MRWVCLFWGTNKIEKRFRRCQSHLHFLLLISVRAENPYIQSHEDANGKIVLMAFSPII